MNNNKKVMPRWKTERNQFSTIKKNSPYVKVKTQIFPNKIKGRNSKKL